MASPRHYIEHSLPAPFRYLHEPLARGDGRDWFVGRDQVARRLADRLMYSSGGAFLVTGFRGVGKTTFVHRVIESIEAEKTRYEASAGPFELVDVWLNLARPIEPVQLLHHLIRHMVLRLRDRDLVSRLDPALQRELETAFLRTTFEISGSSARSEERGRSFGVQPKWVGLEILGSLATSHKLTASTEDALKFLPYDEKAAEFDFVRFSYRLSRGSLGEDETGFGPWIHRLGRRLAKAVGRQPGARSASSLKVVFVLDELDKLEASRSDPSVPSSLDEILETLKTVFTASAFSFVFIAGKELREAWSREVALGDSIYESVFAGDVYLPCLWEEQRELLRRIFGSAAVSQAQGATDPISSFLRYLEYRGRGIPRRLLRELNQHVSWQDGTPVLILDDEQGRVVRVFAKIQEIAAQIVDELAASPTVVAAPARIDSQRLTLYYMLDWLTVRGRRPFAPEDLHDAAVSLNLGLPREGPGEKLFSARLIEVLLHRSVLEEAEVARTLVGEASPAATYRLAAWVADALAVLPATEDQRDEMGSPAGSEVRSIGPYRVLRIVGRGGFGDVYQVWDGQIRALKLLRLDEWDEGEVGRFRREIDLLSRLDHRNVVRFVDAGESEEAVFLVMDFIPGLTLQEVLQRVERLDGEVVVALGASLARTLAYIHDRGIFRLDLKPSNVILSRVDGQPKVIDLGIARAQDEEPDEPAGTVYGTPGYLSPEAVRAEEVGPPSDVFSLGALLYELLTGEPAFRAKSIAQTMRKIMEGPVPPSRLAPVPPGIEALVMEALAPDPRNRPSARELAEQMEALAPLGGPGLVELARRLDAQAAKQFRPAPVTARIAEPREGTLPGAEEDPPASSSPDPVAPEPVPPGPQPLPPDAAASPVVAAEVRSDLRLVLDWDQRVARLEGNGVDLSVPLDQDRLLLGRDESADIQLDRHDVSRYHVAILVSPLGVEVEDLGSSNGSFLNGGRFSRAPMRDGDELVVGQARIGVEIRGVMRS